MKGPLQNFIYVYNLKLSMSLEDSIRKYALENALKFKGKCNPGALVGKLLGEDPSRKAKMGEIMPKINEIVGEINQLSVEDQKAELLKIDPNYFEEQKEQKDKRKESRHELPELKNAVEGKVITRISPEPSKYNHFGHAISFLLNYMYSLKYKGKCVLRFEDTNPEKSTEEFVDAMKEDVLEYLDIKPSKTVFVSDHMNQYYDMAEQLINKDQAYTCSCKSEGISKGRRAMEDCACRSKDNAQTKADWEEMKKGTPEEGSITLRLKIDMQHKNAVMRDPVIFRLAYAKHYKQGIKYKVWPMYDFENAIEEGLLNITHVLRSNEFDSRIELQDHIRDLFQLPNPEVKQYARFKIENAVTQGREIRQLIESGNYNGWDDIRLVTLRALKRRGIPKEAYYELAKIIGMSKANSNLDFDVIAAESRKILDNQAERFFFIQDPKAITINNAPNQTVELDLHPDNKKGGRKFNTNTEFYLAPEDFNKIENGNLIRLMDCLNFKKQDNQLEFVSTNLEDYKKDGNAIIHWLPKEKLIETEILMPDNTTIHGLSENALTKLKVNAVCQFERFGFCRLDSIENNKYKFWFTHK
jgi:glutamyl-tRNA synthetase